MELLYTAHVPPGEGPHPTILALHGWGASAHDLIGLAPHLHGGRALVLCPQGPVSTPIGPGAVGYGWFPLNRGGPLDRGAFESAAQSLDVFLRGAQQRYPIAPDRIVIAGFSQGGVMAYRLFLAEPERFAGLVALSSWLPPELEAPGLDPKRPTARPALVTHGTRDPMIDVERGRESRKRLLGLGVPLTYREYEMGHEIRPETLRDLVRWLDDKVFTPIHLL